MAVLRHVLPLLMLGSALAQPALAQQPTTDTPELAAELPPPPGTSGSAFPLLVADRMYVDDQDRLVAEGAVEILHKGNTLTATRITYDRDADRLLIEGPLRLVDPEGDVVIADAAELSPELRDGVLAGARIVLDQQLQIATRQAVRDIGSATQLSRAAMTSCQVCGSDQLPLWEIRANRVIHDEVARQIYMEHARLRVAGVPVFYTPYLRVPEPGVERAQGFLFPRFRSSSLLGFGIELPYFIPIGDHKDLTLTPYLSTKSTTLGFRYRQAYVNGNLTLDGALSADQLEQAALRGYLFANWKFELEPTLTLEFNLREVTDEAYLNDYSIGVSGRLANDATLTRVEDDRFMQGTGFFYRTLQDEEDATQPTVIADYRRENRIFPRWSGGEWRVGLVGHTHYRASTRSVDTVSDPDSDTDGRDVGRVNADISWRDRWTLPMGLRAGLAGHLWIDHYNTQQDRSTDSSITSVAPAASVELRWPLLASGPDGGRTLLEPMAQLGWVGGERATNANDESTRVEFDEGNLLSLSRYPAEDRRERGLRLATGLRMTHHTANDWRLSAALGKVLHEDARNDFSRSSGLSGKTSDWLVALRMAHGTHLDLSARGLLDETQTFSKAEARAKVNVERVGLSASYLMLVSDPDEARDDSLSEWAIDASYKINQRLRTTAWGRYNLVSEEMDSVGLGLNYAHECAQVDFSARRSYASSDNLDPTTEFELTVALKGFSTGGSAKENRRTCRS